MANRDLIKAVEQLLEETEDKADALTYAKEIAEEIGVTEDEVIDEIERQC